MHNQGGRSDNKLDLARVSEAPERAELQDTPISDLSSSFKSSLENNMGAKILVHKHK